MGRTEVVSMGQLLGDGMGRKGEGRERGNELGNGKERKRKGGDERERRSLSYANKKSFTRHWQ